VGYDKSQDLAVLRIFPDSPASLLPMKWGHPPSPPSLVDVCGLIPWAAGLSFRTDGQLGLPFAACRIGTSSDLRVGQSVYAIGNPFGLSHTLTVGSVSGLRRTIPSASGDRIFGAVQTDASISSGNSGGPLLDSFGRMVGMNTATFTRRGTGRSSGINFAVPIDTIMELVPKIIVRNES